VANTMYTHVSKCKNDKIKKIKIFKNEKKNHNTAKNFFKREGHFLMNLHLIMKHIQRKTYVCIHISFILHSNSVLEEEMKAHS
jgi:hypothetical protein